MTKRRQPGRVALSPQMRRKSLQDLDGRDWGDAPYPSYVVTNVHRLRHIPLQDFTTEDLRLMIGQGFSESLPYLVPLAVERLQDDPFVAGDFYLGDLLKVVVGIAAPFWIQHPDLRREVEVITDQALAWIPKAEEMADFLVKDIEGAINQFRQSGRS